MSDGFAHRLRIDQVHDGDRLHLVAGEDERRAIAKRLDLLGLDRFEAQVTLERDGEMIRAVGRLSASLSQSCVVTNEPVPAHIDEPFEVRFIPEPPSSGPDHELELAPDDCDTMFHDGHEIDLGGAIADTLALSIDPYPRSASADATAREIGLLSEVEASPFAILAQIKGRSSGED
jgi:uncharacterized metal-binding protein YceD (DUF177 family)